MARRLRGRELHIRHHAIENAKENAARKQYLADHPERLVAEAWNDNMRERCAELGRMLGKEEANEIIQGYGDTFPHVGDEGWDIVHFCDHLAMHIMIEERGPEYELGQQELRLEMEAQK